MKKINIGLVDDHQIVREGIIEMFAHDDYIKIMFDVCDGIQLTKELERRKLLPEMLILDLEMPGMNGFEATKFLGESYPDIKIIILSMHTSDEVIIDLIKAGASSYLDKNTNHKELKKAITSVHEIGHYYNDIVSTALANNLNKRKRGNSFNQNVAFSDLELQVIELVYKEMSNLQIAEIVFRSKGSVEAIKRNVFRKMGVNSSAGIIKYSIKHNLISLI